MAKEYYLYVNGQKIKVSEKIYKVYWREREHEKKSRWTRKTTCSFFHHWIMTDALQIILLMKELM